MTSQSRNDVKTDHCWSATRMLAAAAVALVATIAGCSSREQPQVAAQLPAALIVLDGATNVRQFESNDGEVTYILGESHPATQSIDAIRSRLEAAGWERVNEDFMNPGLPTSHVRGWTDFIDGTNNDANVFVWTADWSSPRGDLVRYSFRYVYPKGGGPMDARPPLEVSGSYMSAPTVNRLRSIVPKVQ